MKKLLAVVAVATGLMLSSPASAATVDIEINQITANEWHVLVDNHGAVAIGALNFLVTGLDTMTINASNLGISAADSVISIDPLGDGLHNFVIIQNTATGVSIADAGAQQVLLASLFGPGPVTAEGSEALLGSDTVFGADGTTIISDYLILVHPIQAPEPATLVLLGLGLGGLALVRRRA